MSAPSVPPASDQGRAVAPGLDPALAPVRAWLLDQARRAADTDLAAARARADDTRDDAQAEATRLVAAARAEGEALGAEAAARALARARREARSTVLRARAELQAALRDAVRSAVTDLLTGAEGSALRARLADRAVAVLGPETLVRDAPDGGVLAHAGSRRVDLSARALADAALEQLGAGVTRLWDGPTSGAARA